MSVPPLFGPDLLGHDEFISTADGRMLRTMVRGVGDDLVVLEAGLGASGLYWGPVHAAVAEGARVVAYERAGYGASAPDGHPRDLTRLASDLEAVVDAYPHRGLVLVGHSWGGPIVRTVAARRLARNLPVTGLVLVDQTDENSHLFFSPVMRASRAAQSALLVPLARLGLLARINGSLVEGLGEPLRRAALAASTSADAARATKAEVRHVGDGLRVLKETSVDLGDLEIRVLSGQPMGRVDAKARASLQQAHRRTVDQHPGARFVLAEHSDHFILLTEPDLVASEALSLLS